MQESEQPSKNIPARKLLRGVAWTLATLLLLCVGVYALVKVISDPIEKKLAELKAAGRPTTLREIETNYAKLAEHGNAAADYQAAFAMVDTNGLDRISHAVHKLEPTKPIASEQLKEIEKILANNAVAIQLLEKAANSPNIVFPFFKPESFNSENAVLDSLYDCAKIIQLRVLAALAKKDLDSALNNVRFLFAVANAVKNQSAMSSTHFRLHFQSAVLRCVERILNQAEFETEQIVDLESLLQGAIKIEELEKCFLSARVEAIEFIQGPPPAWLAATNQNAFMTRLGWNITKIGGLGRDLLKSLELFEQLERVLTMSYPEAFKENQKIAWELDDYQKHDSLTSILQGLAMIFVEIPVISISKHAEFTTRLWMTRIALAIEKQKTAMKGKYPRTKEELLTIPGLEKMGDDAFGRPLIYTTLENGYELSTGPNPFRMARKSRQMTNQITFRVEKQLANQ